MEQNLETLMTTNGLTMVRNGDYNWLLLREDNEILYDLNIDTSNGVECFRWKDGILSIFNLDNIYDYNARTIIHQFKVDFKQTSIFVKSMLEVPGSTLGPIYHKNTVQLYYDENEERVDFDTAVKLNEVGFEEPCKFVWDTFDNLIDWENKTGQLYHRNTGFETSVYYSAPTLTQFENWKRINPDKF